LSSTCQSEARPASGPLDGEIVAARIGDEATVKTLNHRGDKIVLTPANPDEEAIEVDPSSEDFAVLGVVCGVFRPFCDDPLQEATEQAE
jgi:repressor LexA